MSRAAKRQKLTKLDGAGPCGDAGAPGTSAGTLPVIRVGGVPEHFNYPWKMVTELGLDAKHGVRVEFVTQALGTGAMIAAAKAGDVDLIVALTEGLVADIVGTQSDLRLLGTYVDTPLCWAISAAGARSRHAAAAPREVGDLRGKTFAVSRLGSGSHLMACVLALNHGWDPRTDVRFKVVGKFAALRDSVNAGEADCFMWETFTTKPFHDSGEVSRAGEITTPWPCFMVAATRAVVGAKLAAVRGALAAVREAAALFHAGGAGGAGGFSDRGGADRSGEAEAAKLTMPQRIARRPSGFLRNTLFSA